MFDTVCKKEALGVLSSSELMKTKSTKVGRRTREDSKDHGSKDRERTDRDRQRPREGGERSRADRDRGDRGAGDRDRDRGRRDDDRDRKDRKRSRSREGRREYDRDRRPPRCARTLPARVWAGERWLLAVLRSAARLKRSPWLGCFLGVGQP
jgi:hypothetical protein